MQSREAFEKTGANDFAGERALVAFLEAAHSALDELAGDELSNRYFDLLAGFASDCPGRREHDQRRDLVAALEKTLAEPLASSGLRVMNRVVSRSQI